MRGSVRDSDGPVVAGLAGGGAHGAVAPSPAALATVLTTFECMVVEIDPEMFGIGDAARKPEADEEEPTGTGWHYTGSEYDDYVPPDSEEGDGLELALHARETKGHYLVPLSRLIESGKPIGENHHRLVSVGQAVGSRTSRLRDEGF